MQYLEGKVTFSVCGSDLCARRRDEDVMVLSCFLRKTHAYAK